MFELRPYQQDCVDRIRGEFARHNNVLLVLPTGGGKCLEVDTPVIMHDGTTKMVQDVQVGDCLMGDDGTPRNVLSLARGREPMYEIQPVKGDAWGCNESHILSLVWNGPKQTGYENGKTRDISVKDYLALPKSQKHCLKQYRTGVDFAPIPDADYSIDPYFLGVWLGDGSKRNTMISATDPEIIECIYETARIWKLNVRVNRQADRKNARPGTKGTDYHIAAGNNLGPRSNPLTLKMRSFNLIENKHIPHHYLTASREQRLQLLAGLLDTDSYYHHGYYEIAQKIKAMADGILFLARSLGYAAYVKPKFVKGVEYHRMFISGDFKDLPMRVERKKPEPRKINKDVRRVGFKVIPKGEGDYYGFEIDGNRRFLLGDFTVTHNTVIFSQIATRAVAKGNKVCILVHRQELVRQSSMTLAENGVPHAIISPKNVVDQARVMQIQRFGNHVVKDDAPVLVASVQTLVRRLHLLDDISLLVIDEAHHTSAGSWQKVAEKMANKKVLGVTATPVRQDGRGLGDFFNAMVEGPTVKWLIDEGYLCKPIIYRAGGADLTGVKTVAGDYNKGQLGEAVERKPLIGDAVDHYEKICPGVPAIAFCVSVKHAYMVAEQFSERGWRAIALEGNTDKTVRFEALEKLAAGELDVVASCDIISEGTDVPLVGCGLMLRPTKSLGLWLQQAGRVLRRYPDIELMGEAKMQGLVQDGVHRAFILDHSGNSFVHGLPQLPRQWTLDTTKPKKPAGDPDDRFCEGCGYIFFERPLPDNCPECGYALPVAQRRGVDVEDGLLEQVGEADQDAILADYLLKFPVWSGGVNIAEGPYNDVVNKADTIEKILQVAKARDYKPGWVCRRAMIALPDVSLSDFQKIAAHYDYKPGWASYKWQEAKRF